ENAEEEVLLEELYIPSDTSGVTRKTANLLIDSDKRTVGSSSYRTPCANTRICHRQAGCTEASLHRSLVIDGDEGGLLFSTVDRQRSCHQRSTEDHLWQTTVVYPPKHLWKMVEDFTCADRECVSSKHLSEN